ncbi:hypothetical protein [Deinococcus sedimenti]|uniref:hypothetical protein n=1 Tax=Deinococcus sedimenti TaxID=1867090 RepID=UPI00166676B1|nr:hypothetical protein [Deinococcus sedimenti]
MLRPQRRPRRTLTLPGGRVTEVQPRALNAVTAPRPQPRPPLRDLDDQGDRSERR